MDAEEKKDSKRDDGEVDSHWDWLKPQEWRRDSFNQQFYQLKAAAASLRILG